MALTVPYDPQRVFSDSSDRHRCSGSCKKGVENSKFRATARVKMGTKLSIASCKRHIVMVSKASESGQKL